VLKHISIKPKPMTAIPFAIEKRCILVQCLQDFFPFQNNGFIPATSKGGSYSRWIRPITEGPSYAGTWLPESTLNPVRRGKCYRISYVSHS